MNVQVARQGAEAEADSMKAEVDAVVARQQERVADWEAAVAEEEAALAAKQQELQATIHGICAYAAFILMGAPRFGASLLPNLQLQGHTIHVSNDALRSHQPIAHGLTAKRCSSSTHSRDALTGCTACHLQPASFCRGPKSISSNW